MGGFIGGTVDANTPGKNPVDARRTRKKSLDARRQQLSLLDADQMEYLRKAFPDSVQHCSRVSMDYAYMTKYLLIMQKC